MKAAMAAVSKWQSWANIYQTLNLNPFRPPQSPRASWDSFIVASGRIGWVRRWFEHVEGSVVDCIEKSGGQGPKADHSMFRCAERLILFDKVKPLELVQEETVLAAILCY